MGIRKPIITVLGHVDAGKTKTLDAIRGTGVAEKEAGGITQHIGATEVPIGLIMKQARGIMEKYKFTISIPGLLFIDTPGHEAFTNLRRRGGSIADLAVVVVDINKGMEEQTKEAIEILKSYRCPFIVAANKVDTTTGWIPHEGTITDALEKQRQDVLDKIDAKLYELVGQLYTMGFASERFDRVTDFTKEIAIIPMSAKAKTGIPELLMFLAALSQKYLEKKLEVHEKGNCRATVLEVREEKGLGKTIDVILYDGMLCVGEEIVVGGKNNALRVKIRALLEPKTTEDRCTDKYRCVQEVHAASGVKISGPGLDDAIAGSPVRHWSEAAEKEVMEEIQRIKIATGGIGPIVRSNTLGSLEAIVKLLQDRGITVSKADVGDIPRKDVMEIEGIMQKDRFRGVIFAFHTKVSEQALEEARKRGVRIFENDVVYRLLEDYEKWVRDEKDREKKAKLATIVMPAKIRVLEGFVFRNSGPAIVGIRVLEGRIRKGIELMKKDGSIAGRLMAIQKEGKNIEEAEKDAEVAVSIDGAVVGRGLYEKDELYSFIPPKSFIGLEALSGELSNAEIELCSKIKEIIESREAGQEDR
ncbi:putative translation initiation factor IF-2 [uncultured archaeon]|nr:putative translation initiation factor IF-2 [uncultured archaeon]